MIDSSLKLMERINLQNQKVQTTPRMINKNLSEPRHILIKLEKNSRTKKKNPKQHPKKKGKQH